MIAIIADTHLPKGSRVLPARCLELLAASEAIVHAGDLCSAEVLRRLQAIGPPVHAVHGNVDDAELRRLLPAVAEVRVGSHRLVVIHDAGPAAGRLRRLHARFPAADAVVFGHSHLPLCERDGDFQIFNPGSPTERRRAPTRSMGLLEISRGKLHFEHVAL